MFKLVHVFYLYMYICIYNSGILVVSKKTLRFSLHFIVFNFGQRAALTETDFLVLRVGDKKFLDNDEIRVPLWATR